VSDEIDRGVLIGRAMSTYILKGGLQEGPYDDEHVQNLLKEGTVRPDDFGWRPGMQSWQKLSTLYPGVHNPAEPPPLPSPTVPPPQPIGKSLPSGKTLGIAVAILACAFLAATVGHILLSLVLGCIGGTLFWQALLPRAAAKWKLAIGVAAGLLCIVWAVAVKNSGEAVRSGERIYALSGDAALEEARQFMIGTWTYTGSKQRFGGPALWNKWVVKADGTMERYTAPATNDSWGSPEVVQWEIRTDKYSDTGERYYAFHIKGHETQAVITRDGKVEYRLPDWTIIMEKGDKFPFSK